MPTKEPDMTATTQVSTVPASTVRGPLLPVVLGLLTMFGPISMDLYLPVLPALGTDLAASASASQLTVLAGSKSSQAHHPDPGAPIETLATAAQFCRWICWPLISG